MAAKSSRTSALTDPKTITDLVRAAKAALAERGDILRLEMLLKGLAAEVEAPAESVDPQVTRARESAEQRRYFLGSELREAASAAGCDLDFKPPHVRVGCVSFQENPKKPGEWSVSILDSVVLSTVSTLDAKVLVDFAVSRIAEIENALQRREAFATDLQYAAEAVEMGSTTAVSANVLMVLCSLGRSLKNALALSDRYQLDRGLSRAQFGYLLAATRDHAESKVKLARLNGATQVETRQPQRYISVPDNPDPRKTSGEKRIASILIEKG